MFHEDSSGVPIAARLYLIGIGVRNSIDILKLFPQEPVSFSHLEEITGLSKGVLASVLRQLRKARLIENVDMKPIINPRTGLPLYKFYALTSDGRKIRDNLQEFKPYVDDILEVLGYGHLRRNIRRSEYFIRLAIVKALHEKSMTRKQLQQRLRKRKSFLSTLTKQLEVLKKIVVEEGNPDNPREKLYHFLPQQTTLGKEPVHDLLTKSTYLQMLVREIGWEELLAEISGGAG